MDARLGWGGGGHSQGLEAGPETGDGRRGRAWGPGRALGEGLAAGAALRRLSPARPGHWALVARGRRRPLRPGRGHGRECTRACASV